MSTLSHFPNSTLGALANRIENTVVGLNRREVLESPKYLFMVNANKMFTLGFNQVDRSILTPEIKAADKQRNAFLKSLWDQVKSDLNSPLPNVQQAAFRILNILKSEGSLSSIMALPMGDRSRIVQKLLDNLASSSAQADVATLNAGVKVDALATAHGGFEAIYARRSDEKAVAGTIASATKQRRELEDAIREFMKFVDSKANIDTDPFWSDLRSKIDERIDELSRSYRPKTRAKKSPEK